MEQKQKQTTEQKLEEVRQFLQNNTKEEKGERVDVLELFNLYKFLTRNNDNRLTRREFSLYLVKLVKTARSGRTRYAYNIAPRDVRNELTEQEKDQAVAIFEKLKEKNKNEAAEWFADFVKNTQKGAKTAADWLSKSENNEKGAEILQKAGSHAALFSEVCKNENEGGSFNNEENARAVVVIVLSIFDKLANN